MEMADLLGQFGLTEKQAQVFCELVKRDLGALEISKRTGVSRPYVYTILRELEDRGFVQEVQTTEGKLFSSTPRDIIMSNQEQQLDELQSLLEELESDGRADEKTDCQVLRGPKTVRNACKFVLAEIKPGSEYLSLGTREELMERLEPVYIRKVLNYFSEHDISERIIIPDGTEELKYAETSSYRTLPSDELGMVSKGIFDDYVIEFVYTDPVEAVILQNRTLASAERSQFDALWNRAAGIGE